MRTSFLLYPLVNAAHILCIGTLVATAVLMDVRVLGLGKGIALDAVIGHLRPLAIGALVLAALSGVLLFSVQPFDYAANPAFRIKLILLAAAIANAVLFFSVRAHRRPTSPLSQLMATTSIALWLSVLIAGRFIGFIAV